MALSTRDQLLETAARLFHEQGYAATGVATILQEQGFSHIDLIPDYAGVKRVITAQWFSH